MAQKVHVILVDDVDGGAADESLTFALDGINYEIDVSSANAEAIREALSPWIEHARRIGGRATGRGRAAKSRPAVERIDMSDVRAWARENGYQVSDRGRVSGEVRAAYEAAH